MYLGNQNKALTERWVFYFGSEAGSVQRPEIFPKENIVGHRFGRARTRAGIYSEHAAAAERSDPAPAAISM